MITRPAKIHCWICGIQDAADETNPLSIETFTLYKPFYRYVICAKCKKLTEEEK